MTGWFRAIPACAALALAPVAARADWSGTAGPYSAEESASDIVVKVSGRTVFSAKAFAAAQYARLLVEFELPLRPIRNFAVTAREAHLPVRVSHRVPAVDTR